MPRLKCTTAQESATELYAQIEYYRARSGLTKRELCKRIGITLQTLSNYKSNPGHMTRSTMERMSRALDMPPEVFVRFGA